MNSKLFIVIILVVFLGLVLFGSRLNVPPWALTALLLLACPLSMAFMHGGHDHEGEGHDSGHKGTGGRDKR